MKKLKFKVKQLAQGHRLQEEPALNPSLSASNAHILTPVLHCTLGHPNRKGDPQLRTLSELVILNTQSMRIHPPHFTPLHPLSQTPGSGEKMTARANSQGDCGQGPRLLTY